MRIQNGRKRLSLFYARYEHIIFLSKKKEIWNDYCSLSLAIRESYFHLKMKIYIKSWKFSPYIFFLKWNSRNLNTRNFAILETRESFSPRKFLPLKYTMSPLPLCLLAGGGVEDSLLDVVDVNSALLNSSDLPFE